MLITRVSFYGHNSATPKMEVHPLRSGKISFQPPGFYKPKGWMEDNGLGYSNHKFEDHQTREKWNATFGWNKLLSSATWEIDTPNITYKEKFIEDGISLEPCDALQAAQNTCETPLLSLSLSLYLSLPRFSRLVLFFSQAILGK